MNFYRRFPGDYGRDTSHLNFQQHGAYSLLLDIAYSTEKPLPLSKKMLYRMTRAGSRSERAAIDFVIANFFTRTLEGFTHKRVSEEINHAESRINASRENGSRSKGRPRKENPVGLSEKPGGVPGGNPEPNLEKSSPDSRLQTPDESCLAHAVSSSSPEPKNAGASPHPVSVEKEIRKTAECLDPAARGIAKKSAKELDERRRLLLDQGEKMKRKFAN